MVATNDWAGHRDGTRCYREPNAVIITVLPINKYQQRPTPKAGGLPDNGNYVINIVVGSE
jgi:hypothetical protein